MKQQTIPKLELQAALYSVRLRQLITEDHDIKIQTVTHWTDSMTVLQWLHSVHTKQNFSVANRVGEIMEESTLDEWRHKKCTMNPEDIGNRVVTVSQLLENEWLKGPPWLKQNPTNGPEQAKLVDEDDIVLTTNPTLSVIDWSRLSKFKRRINVIAYCLRFKSKQRGVVTALERQRVALVVMKMTQRESFASWLANLKTILEKKWSMICRNFPQLLTLTTRLVWGVDRAKQQSVMIWHLRFYSQPSILRWFWCWEKCMRTTTMRGPSMWEA